MTTNARDADTIIIGGGLTGLSSALHLLESQPGRSVTLFEANRVGFGASSRSSGMLTPGVGQSLASLVSRFGANGARELYQASLDAVQYAEELTRSKGIDAHMRMTGQLVVARGAAGRRRLAAQASLLSRLGLPCETLDDNELRAIIRTGIRAPGAGPAALRLPVAGVLDPVSLVSGMAAAVRALGGTIVEGSQVSSIEPGERVRVALTNGAAATAANVVVATNGYDGALGLQRGRALPLHLRILLTEPLAPEQLDGLGWRGREGAIDSRRVFNYFRLTHDNRLLFGGGAPRYRWGGAQQEIPNNHADFQRLAAEFRDVFPMLAPAKIERTWTGVIAYSLDNLPIIGLLPGRPNVVYAGGWCGHGIALSLTSGRWVSDLLRGDTPREAARFAPRSLAVPTELARWTGARLGSAAMRALDQVA